MKLVIGNKWYLKEIYTYLVQTVLWILWIIRTYHIDVPHQRMSSFTYAKLMINIFCKHKIIYSAVTSKYYKRLNVFLRRTNKEKY